MHRVALSTARTDISHIDVDPHLTNISQMCFATCHGVALAYFPSGDCCELVADFVGSASRSPPCDTLSMMFFNSFNAA